MKKEDFYIPFQFDRFEKSEKDNKYYIYIKATSETLDQQGERVLQKALEDQKRFFLKYGIIDFDHFSKKDRKNADRFIIGEPVDIGFEKSKKETYVKGFLYDKVPKAESIKRLLDSGSTRIAASVGGGIFAKSRQFNPITNKNETLITKVRFDHIALTPTHQAVLLDTQVSKIPIGVFAKSLSDDVTACLGCKTCNGCLDKALEAGSQTDSAKISGGQSTQKQSLEGNPQKSISILKNSVSKLLKKIKKRKIKPTLKSWEEFLMNEGLDKSLVNQTIQILLKSEQIKEAIQ